MHKVLSLMLVPVLVQGIVACDDAEETGNPEADADTDVDSDTDVDTGVSDADGDGWTIAEGDCDDLNSNVNPGVPERCNGIDDDCDGATDEDDAVDASTWYADTDDDSYGDPSSSRTACEPGSGWVADDTDCDDTDPDVNPDGVEYCGGGDEDCDGTVDEDGAADAPTWRQDADRDTFGSSTVSWTRCTCPANWVADAEPYDCDDADASVHPGAEEVAGDEVDQDCDGTEVCFLDEDGDDYGVETTVASTDDDCSDDGESRFDSDCDDENASINPGADEVCGDGVDDDCSGADVSCREWGEIDLSEADAKLVGEDAYDLAGRSVAAGDVDGDGFEDILVGASAESAGGSYAGAVYLVLGPVSGEVDLSLADAKLTGARGEYAGSSVTAGDTDGDGFEDILVGAPQSSAGGHASGAAYLVLGPVSGEVDLSGADAELVGEGTRTLTGNAVAVGDLDGDGNEDMLVGAYGEYEGGSSAGAAFVVYSPVSGTVYASEADAKLVGVDEYDYAGTAVATGDVDGDGIEDAVVSAGAADAGGAESGAVYVISGPVYGTLDLSAADATLAGEAYDYVGDYSIAVGDVDGDGVDDILTDGAWEAFLVLGSVSGTISLPTEAEAILEGYAMSVTIADVDADGASDLVVGKSGDEAYLFFAPVSGTVDLSLADATFLGEESGDRAGEAVAGGDTDGDGAADILVGAYNQDAGGSDAGAVYLILGGGS